MTSRNMKTLHAENMYFHEQISVDPSHGHEGLSPDEAVVGGAEAALRWRGNDVVVVVSKLS